MAAPKTRPGFGTVAGYLRQLEDPDQRRQCRELKRMMGQITGKRARLWGDSLVGFGRYHYQYASGREGDWPLTGFSARKRNLVIYIMPGFGEYGALMKRLGKYKTGKSCLYLKKLEDVDGKVLRQLVQRSVRDMRRRYPGS